jgi:hypothetical protein
VLSAPEGTRNDTLNRAAHAVLRFPQLDADAAERALLNVARAAGLPELEALRTIRSARKARGR